MASAKLVAAVVGGLVVAAAVGVGAGLMGQPDEPPLAQPETGVVDESRPAAERCAICRPADTPKGVRGELCRYGKDEGGDDCDPDAAQCHPWPCVVLYGQQPERVFVEHVRGKSRPVPAWAKKYDRSDAGL